MTTTTELLQGVRERSQEIQPKLYSPRNSLETIAKSYQERGYTSIVDTINKHLPAYEKLCEIGSTNYKIEQIEICNTQSKKLYADIFLDYREQRPALLIENLKIQDLCTGKVQSANKILEYCSENNFNIFDMPKSEVENLLSGGKELIPGKPTGQFMGLNKTALGFGLKTCQQLFSIMDSSAEI